MTIVVTGYDALSGTTTDVFVLPLLSTKYAAHGYMCDSAVDNNENSS